MSAEAEVRVSALWVGRSLGRLEQACLASFVRTGHRVVLYAEGRLDRAPEGVELRDAREVWPGSPYRDGARAGRSRSGYGAFSDLFRYLVLQREGGWWVDTDMVALRRLDSGSPYCFGQQSDELLNSAVMRAPRGCRLLRYLAHRARYPFLGRSGMSPMGRLKRWIRYADTLVRPGNVPWGESGPTLLTAAVKRYRLERYCHPAHVFYPVPYARWRDLFFGSADSLREELADSHTVHLWAEMLRINGVPRDTVLPDRSFVGRLLAGGGGRPW